MKLLIGFGIGLVLVVAAWAAVWAWLPHYYPVMSEAGQLGDSFGLITSLFSGLTMIGAAYAVYAQNKQLQLAHKQDVALQDQLKIAREQRDEDARERDRNLKLQESQAVAQRLASELRAYDSLIQHHNSQNKTIAYGQALFIHMGDHELVRYLQMVKIVLTEIQFSDHDFDWKEVQEIHRNRFMKYFIVIMREAKPVYQDHKANSVQHNVFYNLVTSIKKELDIIITQKGFDPINSHWIVKCLREIDKLLATHKPPDLLNTDRGFKDLDDILLHWHGV